MDVYVKVMAGAKHAAHQVRHSECPSANGVMSGLVKHAAYPVASS